MTNINDINWPKILILLVMIGAVFLWSRSDAKQDEKRDEKKENMKSTILNVKCLELLKSNITNLDIPQYSKEKILKAVEWELEMVKRDVIIQMGEVEYKKLEEKK